jgi:hypothetical protein
MNKQQILQQVENLTAEELFNYICQGIVTLEELKNTGNLDATKRKAISNLQNKRKEEDRKRAEEDDRKWEELRYTESGCRSYLEQYPAGRHAAEAKQKIDDWEEQRREEQKKKQEILDSVRRNPNSFTPGMLRTYLNDGIISRSDLVNFGIPKKIIGLLDNIVSPNLELGKTPDSIPDGYTEVYFWGIPGSGKTCALSAILSTAENFGYLEIAPGPGYDYMTRLKNIFFNPVAFLPPPSPVETTQYLPFVLKKDKDKPRSVSLIELSGEIFQCFYHQNAGRMDKLSDAHKDTFNSLIRFLKGKNRKIHFFFVDYEKENKPDADGYTQTDYLQAAATFFKNNDVFGNSTDAIYLVITKSDLMSGHKNERKNEIKEYLSNHNFKAFVNSLKARCKQHSINAGDLTAIPFSLGKVYFQQICELDRDDAKKIIGILLDRIPPKKTSILDVFNR